jgi:hypothetical protein
MSRGFAAALTAVCFALATMTVPPMIGFGVSDAQAATTVKSSKSNTSDRMGGGGGKGKAARGKTVKSGKSNTSDRMGGGGGKGFGGVQLNPQPEPPGRAKAR